MLGQLTPCPAAARAPPSRPAKFPGVLTGIARCERDRDASPTVIDATSSELRLELLPLAYLPAVLEFGGSMKIRLSVRPHCGYPWSAANTRQVILARSP